MKKSMRSGKLLGSVGQYVGELGDIVEQFSEDNVESRVWPQELVTLDIHSRCFTLKSPPMGNRAPRELKKSSRCDSDKGWLGIQYTSESDNGQGNVETEAVVAWRAFCRSGWGGLMRYGFSGRNGDSIMSFTVRVVSTGSVVTSYSCFWPLPPLTVRPGWESLY